MTLIISDELASTTGTLVASPQVAVRLPSGQQFSVPVNNLNDLAEVIRIIHERLDLGDVSSLNVSLKDILFLDQVIRDKSFLII